MNRRAILSTLGGLSFLGPLLATTDALAGSYLNRAQLLLSLARLEADFMRPRFGDKELARIVMRLTQARVEAASRMLVPKEVV
ncbi:MAG TPA: hypothetical protein VIM73_17185, partial [Polyangiaceae bacterium]